MLPGRHENLRASLFILGESWLELGCLSGFWGRASCPGHDDTAYVPGVSQLPKAVSRIFIWENGSACLGSVTAVDAIRTVPLLANRQMSRVAGYLGL